MPSILPRGTWSALLWILLAGGDVASEVVTLGAVADTCLWELDPDYNFGRQRTLPAGSIGVMFPASADRARALFKFDVLGAIPSDAVIQSARMTLTVSTQIPAGPRISDFSLSRVLVDWEEGAGIGENPGGRVALGGESTWNKRIHPDVDWSSPGGVFGTDFAETSSALVENVSGSDSTPSPYGFEFNAGGLADLESMVRGTLPNYGWVLHSLGEGTRKTARRWVSRETINEGPAPKLEITYTIPPEVPPEITAVDIDPETQELSVRVEGKAGIRYELQSGPDLIDWNPGEVQVPDTDRELVFRVPLGPAERFVRVEATRVTR